VGAVLGDEPVAVARDAVVDARRARERLDAFDRRLDDADASAAELRWASRALRRTAERAGDVAEVGLRRAVRCGEPIRDAE
jgi:hypothetical protein